MKVQQQSDRKARTRLLIQVGGLLQKSGLMDAFNIESSDDLQAYENFEKASQLLGFLIECLENNKLDEANLKQWKSTGESFLKSD